MIARKKSTAGFAWLGLLLLAAVTIVVAITTNQRDTQATQATSQFLVIKEWGVQFPITDAIKGAYYTTAHSNVGTDGLPNTAWLGIASLNSSGCNVVNFGPSSTDTPVGSIIRVATIDHDPVSGEFYTEQYPDGVIIGNYYYVYLPWKNSKCAAASAKSINSAFSTAAKDTTVQVVR